MSIQMHVKKDVRIVPKVLDISHHNSVIDFGRIRDAGIVGIIHKASQHVADEKYAPRRKAAKQAGLLWGAYHFNTGKPVDDQIDLFMRTAQPDDGDCMVLDYEQDFAKTPSNMTIANAQKFMQRLDDKLGRLSMVYSGNRMREQLVDPDMFEFFGKHRLWHCQYNQSKTDPTRTGHIEWHPAWDYVWLFQYTDGAPAPGKNPTPGPHDIDGMAKGGLDINSYLGTEQELRDEWAGAPV